MKKILWIAAPIAIVAMLFAAHSAFSYGGMRHGHGEGMFGEMMVFHLQNMAKDLNLTADQQSRLDAIEQGMHQSMDQRTSKREQFHSTIQQQISSGTFDFSQIRPMLDAQIDDRAAAAHAAINSMQQFFDSLNADQKSKIAADLKQHMDQMQERKQRWEQKKNGSTSNPPQNPSQN